VTSKPNGPHSAGGEPDVRPATACRCCCRRRLCHGAGPFPSQAVRSAGVDFCLPRRADFCPALTPPRRAPGAPHARGRMGGPFRSRAWRPHVCSRNRVCKWQTSIKDAIKNFVSSSLPPRRRYPRAAQMRPHCALLLPDVAADMGRSVSHCSLLSASGRLMRPRAVPCPGGPKRLALPVATI